VWWVKESKEFSKQKLAKEEKDNSEFTSPAPKVTQELSRAGVRIGLSDGDKLKGVGSGSRKLRPLTRRSRRSTPNKKKKFFVKGLKAHHTKATHDRGTLRRGNGHLSE